MNNSLYMLNYFFMFSMFTIMFLLWMNMNINPVYTTSMLILFTLISCMNMSIWSNSYIYSYLMFLMMIGGVLILFIYFSCSNSNKSIKFNFKYMYMYIYMLILMIFLFKKNSSITNFMINFWESSTMNIYLIYSYPFNTLLIISIIYLIFCLINIMKMCSMYSFPMRKF